jgi:hypothetical protein
LASCQQLPNADVSKARGKRDSAGRQEEEKLAVAQILRLGAAATGEDYDDWYLETWVEGAKENEPEAPPPIQPYFAGMTPRFSIEIESF